MSKLALIFLISFTAMAADRSEPYDDSWKFEPCQFWNNNPTTGGWDCKVIGPLIRVPVLPLRENVESLKQIVEKQNQRIADLEARLKALE